ncbi:uncharacterized protein LOC126909825, partial [Daktulosphaira vitifoliae]|uniref:uncharacterized protein LOC126909825 n=2 Tax=Daktulosphaira vitifoliae TaxID=58002 RepID=UPI0021A98262
DVEERLKTVISNGFSTVENELHFIPQPYLKLLKFILNKYEQNDDDSIITVCKNFNDKYDSFLVDQKYATIKRLTLPLYYVALIKIDGRPLKEFILNKKLLSFINELCMKMFCALVNSFDNMTITSENNKLPNVILDEYLCFNVSSKCCFLLTAVRGIHSDPSILNKYTSK